jgi:hypothetical protein
MVHFRPSTWHFIPGDMEDVSRLVMWTSDVAVQLESDYVDPKNEVQRLN